MRTVYTNLAEETSYVSMEPSPSAPTTRDVYENRLYKGTVGAHRQPLNPVGPLVATVEWPISAPKLRGEIGAVGGQQLNPPEGYPWGSLEALVEESDDECGGADCHGGGQHSELVDSVVPGEAGAPQETQSGREKEEQ